MRVAFSAYINPDAGKCATLYTPEGTTEITPESAAGCDETHKTYGFYDETRHFVESILARPTTVNLFRRCNQNDGAC